MATDGSGRGPGPSVRSENAPSQALPVGTIQFRGEALGTAPAAVALKVWSRWTRNRHVSGTGHCIPMTGDQVAPGPPVAREPRCKCWAGHVTVAHAGRPAALH